MRKIIKHIVTFTIEAGTREELGELEDIVDWELQKMKKAFLALPDVSCDIETVD